MSFGTHGSLTVSGGAQGLRVGNFSKTFLDAAGRITVVVTRDNDQASEIAVTRYSAAGRLDAAWGVGGKTSIHADQDIASCGAGT